MIIVDENVDQRLIEKLTDQTSGVISIRDSNPGISDQEVIKLARSKKGIVITEDKDFVELIFSYNLRGCSVILLRYEKTDLIQIGKNIFKALHYFENNPGHYFITITIEKIRVRKI